MLSALAATTNVGPSCSDNVFSSQARELDDRKTGLDRYDEQNVVEPVNPGGVSEEVYQALTEDGGEFWAAWRYQ